MPGILGIISQRTASEYEPLVKTMVETMRHEPFYKSGTFSCASLGIYAGWVALEHSMGTGQPCLASQGEVVLLFAGEFFGALKAGVSSGDNGAAAATQADGVLRLYTDKGEECFPELNGLFSGLLIDKRRRKAFLFNDRYGLERIYWHKTTDAFYFASEAKALLRMLPQLREFDTDGVAEFLSFGCTIGSRTLFRGIETLPPASLWCFEGEKCKKDGYFSPAVWEAQEPLSAELFAEQFSVTFRQILPRYFALNQALGISLTAGLDSRMIMACLGEVAPPLICYTFSGEKRDPLDARIAARVASACGLEHRILRLESDFFREFQANADRTVYLTDGTLGPFGTHEIYFNRKARKLAPIRLTGVLAARSCEAFLSSSRFGFRTAL